MAFEEDAGLEAIETTNANEAILIPERRRDIRTILTDIDMPGSMAGLRLAAAVSDRRPPIRILPTKSTTRGLFLRSFHFESELGSADLVPSRFASCRRPVNAGISQERKRDPKKCLEAHDLS